MIDKQRDSYLIDGVADEIKAQLKELLPKLEDFPTTLAGNTGDDYDKSVECPGKAYSHSFTVCG